MSANQIEIRIWSPEEKLPREQLKSLQLRRLQETVSRAFHNVSHYHEALERDRLTPDSIKSLDDLRRIPFTVKDDLRKQYPLGMLAVPREKVVRYHASSGTTGKPTVVAYTRKD
ncbi:MAG TPA: phenylacetate--CoA ligase, partial [bacterium]|nr:phenylacetate--CoA ligase [bacterium]